MKLVRSMALALGMVALLSGAAWAASYNYVKADEVAKMIRDKSNIAIVDIQVKEGFEKEHLKGAIRTEAYPVKSDSDKAKLEAVLPQLQKAEKVVIVCPKGKGGANNTYDYLLSKGFSKDKLYTLEDGQMGWPREKISDVLAK